jgi:hypothetical protein
MNNKSSPSLVYVAQLQNDKQRERLLGSHSKTSGLFYDVSRLADVTRRKCVRAYAAKQASKIYIATNVLIKHAAHA